MIVNLVRRSEQTENKAVQQTDLRAPVRLAFANHMDVAGDRAPSSPEGAKILTRAAPALDRAMILFEYIVEILHRSMSTVLLQNALGFELYNGRRVSGILVGVDDPRARMVRNKALARKRLAATVSRLAERRKSIVAPVEST